MYRKSIQDLCEWKVQKRRKPLVLMGARQVGKTYILKKFAKQEYKDYVYINFEDSPNLKKLFENSLKSKDIIQQIEISLDVEITPGETLIIFDEIQECPEALNSLKYFNEEGSEYHVCSAGSLLGVKLMHTKGFPVGQVDFHYLYPLSFIEFLLALGQDKLVEFLDHYRKLEPLPELIHHKLIGFYTIYLFVGGMPEAVVEYVETKNVRKVRQVHEAILQAYALDFAKHAPADQVIKINQIWDAIPGQLAKENKKFIYSVIRKGARSKDFELAVQWLKEAGMIHKVYHISAPSIPLDAYANFDFFKLYLLDTGLLGAKSKLPPESILEGHELFKEFKGSLVENFVAKEFVRHGYGLYYWTSEGRAELDFVLQHKTDVYPVEVKSGNSNKKQSLRVYQEKYQPSLSIRVSPKNLKKDGDIVNCPLYLIGKIGEMI